MRSGDMPQGAPVRNRRNYYRLLQVQPDAPVEVIRASYRALMRDLKQHPDLGGSTEAAALLNEAHRVLTNPALRADYDRALSARFPRRTVQDAEAAPPAPDCNFCGTPLDGEPDPGQLCPTCRCPLRSRPAAELERLSRRAVARMSRHEPVYYRSRWPQEPREAVMVDLSPTGIRFLCPEELAPGAVLKLAGAGFEATAVVKNSRRDGELHAVGAAFLAVEFDNPRGSFLSTSA